MKVLLLAIVGVILIVMWPPLALMYLIVVISLYLFQKYHTRRLAEAEQSR